MRVVATAGHVDHGKSSLVLALTGTDPDRFAEEKERGLTIDLGFAFTRSPAGVEIGFVDVPGHVKFIKNMLAGVGAVEVVMLVVAANEGWMPQSEEHLRIAELLGVHHGLTALTKADTVDEETLELARLELDESLDGTFLSGAPVAVCDSVSGRGLDDVRAALDATLKNAPPPVDRGRPRLWVDRVFSAKGAGTVVTGTLAGGSFAVDDHIEVGPARRQARVRGIETAYRWVERAGPGARVALNLAGVDHHAVRRGDAVVRPGQWLPADVVDVALRPLPGVRLARRAVLHCHVGSGEYEGRLRILDDSREHGRLRLAQPVPLVPGDRVVLRDPGRRRTVGGAEVLVVAPSSRASEAPARLGLTPGARLLAERRWVRRADLGALAGTGNVETDELARDLLSAGTAVPAGDWLVDPDELARVRGAATDRVRAHHSARPRDPGMEVQALARAVRLDPARLRAALEGAGDLLIERGAVRHASHQTRVTGTLEGERLVRALAAEPFSPPDPVAAGGDPGLVRALVREGMLVDLDGLVFAASAIDEARDRVRRALRERGSVTVADVRDLLGSTRKYVLPILSRLDAEGVTRRRGDDRFPGAAAFREK
jgi:selenocysteine-specific elongation factor